MQETSLADGLIKRRFRELGRQNEAALIAYLTGGDPDPESFIGNASALIEGGADIVEVGIPFSDPIADGPVIQASSSRALANGATPVKILDSVKDLSDRFKEFPFVILTYYNPVLAMGVERFVQKSRECGVSGVVIPDLPVEEADKFHEKASDQGVDHILLAAPNTSESRLLRIMERTSGFLYLVSLYGVTGPRESLGLEAVDNVRRVKNVSRGRIPIAAGFGVTHPDHVASLVRGGADGVIAGSALVRIVAECLENPVDAQNHLKRTVSDMKQHTRK